jgi:hypothetical protein
MTMKHDDIKAIQTAIENLANHPPETPMEKLRAALLVAEANQILADEAENAERLRRRTTLPDNYRVLARKVKAKRDSDPETMWSVFFRHGEGSGHLTGLETVIGAARYREKACELAWSHHTDPDLFE